MKAYVADSNHISTHVRTGGVTPSDLDHYHLQYDFGSSYVSQSEADAYWDRRFYLAWQDEGATNTYNCHMYAAQEAGCTGAYNYMALSNEIDTLFADDFTERESNDDVEVYDVLRYGYPHSTVVMGVSGNKPNALRWKWSASGVYTYDPKSGTEFDTPMCEGSEIEDKTLDEQGWTWTESFVSSPTVYEPI